MLFEFGGLQYVVQFEEALDCGTSELKLVAHTIDLCTVHYYFTNRKIAVTRSGSSGLLFAVVGIVVLYVSLHSAQKNQSTDHID